jgi:hypothetical protein
MTSEAEPTSLPPSGPQTAGFLVVQRAPVFAARFLELCIRTSPAPDLYREELARLQQALPGIALDRYRGPARAPVDRWGPPPDPQFWADLRAECLADGRDVSWMEEAMRPHTFSNDRARRHMYERLGPLPDGFWEPAKLVNTHLIREGSLAREVLSLTDRPEEHEVVGVALVKDRLPATLGFDVAQWSGSPFSLIVDTMLAPEIGPSPEVAELLPYARQVNGNMRFPTARQAQAFHDWYVALPYYEGCPGPFAVVRVDGVESDQG